MRAIFIVPHLRQSGGIRRFVQLAEGLIREGHEAGVVYLDFLHADWVREYDVPVSWHRFHIPKADVYVMPAIKEAPEIFPQLPGKRVLLLLGNPEQAEAFTLPFDGVMVTSDWLRDFARERHKNVVKIGVGLEPFFRPGPRPADPRCVGTTIKDTKEGPEFVAEALRLAQESTLRAKLRVLSFSDNRVEGDTLHYTSPPRRALPHIYNACGIWLAGSAREGFGMPGLEALACGCVLITRDTLGCREYAKNGVTAVVVDTPRDMAVAIAELVRNDDMRLKMRERGIEVARTFNWTHVHAKTEAFLRGLCGT